MKNIFFNIFKITAMFSLLWIWLFVGIEIYEDEFDTLYYFFIKKHATIKVFFKDGVLADPRIDLIDLKLDNLSKGDLKDFNALCYYRYDLQPIEYCYKYIYETPGKSELELYELYEKNALFFFSW